MRTLCGPLPKPRLPACFSRIDRAARSHARSSLFGSHPPTATAKAPLPRYAQSHQTKRIHELETELTALVKSYATQLLAERGCGALTAAKLIGKDGRTLREHWDEAGMSALHGAVLLNSTMPAVPRA